MQIHGLSNWQNFGHSDVKIYSPHHLAVHSIEQSAALKGPVDHAVMEGFTTLFDTPSHVEFEIHHATSYTFHVRLDHVTS